ncbi:hypothetical protein HK100_000195 [Physocladia obscura]|uniref:Uncharacterized protein n=1 Tax=Physocladia obscura TaxID=109957 RepID=A0AAD5T1B5_9FUNG|nr:hypothetical protein HK100_000195 [Physocladia obscura]
MDTTQSKKQLQIEVARLAAMGGNPIPIQCCQMCYSASLLSFSAPRTAFAEANSIFGQLKLRSKSAARSAIKRKLSLLLSKIDSDGAIDNAERTASQNKRLNSLIPCTIEKPTVVSSPAANTNIAVPFEPSQLEVIFGNLKEDLGLDTLREFEFAAAATQLPLELGGMNFSTNRASSRRISVASLCQDNSEIVEFVHPQQETLASPTRYNSKKSSSSDDIIPVLTVFGDLNPANMNESFTENNALSEIGTNGTVDARNRFISSEQIKYDAALEMDDAALGILSTPMEDKMIFGDRKSVSSNVPDALTTLHDEPIAYEQVLDNNNHKICKSTKSLSVLEEIDCISVRSPNGQIEADKPKDFTLSKLINQTMKNEPHDSISSNNGKNSENNFLEDIQQTFFSQSSEAEDSSDEEIAPSSLQSFDGSSCEDLAPSSLKSLEKETSASLLIATQSPRLKNNGEKVHFEQSITDQNDLTATLDFENTQLFKENEQNSPSINDTVN